MTPYLGYADKADLTPLISTIHLWFIISSAARWLFVLELLALSLHIDIVVKIVQAYGVSTHARVRVLSPITLFNPTSGHVMNRCMAGSV